MNFRLIAFFLVSLFSVKVFADEGNSLCNSLFFHEKKETSSGDQKDSYLSLDPYHLSVQMKKYEYSTFFEIDSEDSWRGNVKKSKFRLRDNYDLSDKNGWCATGIKRIVSLGSFFNWAAEVDIFGVNGVRLGYIEGKLLTTAKAKFYIYNREDNLVAIAYFDIDNKGVTISPPDNETFTLARFNRIFTPDIHDSWEVVVYEPEIIDSRIIRIFAAFCVDVQDSFHKDI
jgi:hypothetical protein